MTNHQCYGKEGFKSALEFARGLECLYSDGRLDELIDPRLKNEIAPECLKAYAAIGYKCSNEWGNERPTTAAVLKRLQLNVFVTGVY
ncbi:hypothetical protein REPUB_Repub15cG0132200 [Reevesia pubescens]